MGKKNLPFYRVHPFYVLLLPLFFVVHGYKENYGLIVLGDILLLLGSYCLVALVLTGLLYAAYRNISKAAFLAALLLGIYFFFGAIHDFLKAHSGWWHRYSVLLPVFLLVIVITSLLLKKAVHNFYRVNLFFNGLLLIYLLVDVAAITWKALHPAPNPLSVVSSGYRAGTRPCDTCSSPDIYFLVFDEYSSTVNLKETFQYNNQALDSFLAKRGFFIQAHSFSNYNFTPFSVASILNMNYVNGLGNPDSVVLADYTNCERLIKDNQVIDFLSAGNYECRNYSIFDLAGSPSSVEVSLLPVKTKLITAQTLFRRLWRDIGWNFVMGRFRADWITRGMVYNNLDLNNRILKEVQAESRASYNRPRFIYAHFEMPHWPFYYDKNGQMRSQELLIAEVNGSHTASYTNYLPYTNSKIEELVKEIQKNTNGGAAIIIMGDHGYRAGLRGVSRDHYFQNLNAVYFPRKNYGLLKDSISGVNQFRVVFNTLFNQSFPLLKDSAVFLTDYHPVK